MGMTVAETRIPVDSGRYTFAIAFAEFQGQTLGASCDVIIEDDRVTVLHNGQSRIQGSAGDVIVKGYIRRHRSGEWIVSEKSGDENAAEIGGCTDGPYIIDLENRVFWMC